MSINHELLGKRIKRIRHQRGLSQADLAELVDVSVPYISQVETAKKSASIELVTAIAVTLNVSVDYLLTGREFKTITRTESKLYEVVLDCSPYEERILTAILLSTKEILQNNRKYLEEI